MGDRQGRPPLTYRQEVEEGLRSGEPVKPRTLTGPERQTPREEAQRLEAAIKEHAWTAAEHAEQATAAVNLEEEDRAYAHAQTSAAHAAAAQALALLRHPRFVETR